VNTGSLLYTGSENITESIPLEQKQDEDESNDKKEAKTYDAKFDPTIKLLLRISKTILDSESIGRTTLTLNANVNYTILTKYLEWLAERALVEFFIDDGKVKVRLTTIGIEFTFRLCGLLDEQEL